MTTVKVGDRELPIAEFSSYKFLEATELLAAMLEIVPDLDTELAKFGRDWRDSNPERTITRATAELEFGAAADGITDAAWEAAGGQLTITPRPDGTQTAIRLFPKVFRHARADMVNLLALVVTPNSELEDAEREGQDIYANEGCVGKNRRTLLHHGRPTELVKVLLAAMEALGDEIQEGDLVSAVGKLRDRWATFTGTPTPEQETEEPKPNRATRRRASGGRRSSTTSSSPTRAGSPEPKSSTASPTASS